MAEENKKVEKQEEEKTKPEATKPKENKKRDNAIVHGKDLGISTKHAVAICNFIRGKKIRWAIEQLEKVAKKKLAIPMKGEIPHRKGMMSGRYPVSASKVMIKLLKSLDANAKSFEIIEPRIEIAKADKASSPYRRFGSRRFKRTHVFLMAKASKEK